MTDSFNFKNFLRPQSVAIVGASPQRGSPRNTLLRNLQKHGYAGRIYPVSPSHSEIEGLKAYKSVRDLPEPADIALIITPANTVPAIIAECGQSGIRNAVVFSAGFEEVEGGDVLARQLADAARENKVAVLGPNCQGIWSVQHKAILTFSPAALNRDEIHHAPIAIVSQSGALAGAMANALLRIGLGCSYVVSVGNETCMDSLDALDNIVEQEDVRSVALYVEGLDDAARILSIAHKARSRGVQIVVLKTGRSAIGQEATASHTGKIASSHAVYNDVLDQAGIISVNSLQEVVSAMEVLTFLPDPRISGDAQGGISIMSASGGAGALLADYSSERAVPLAQFSTAAAERLDQVLPKFARKANPIDLTGQINTDRDLFRNTCEVLADDTRTEAVAVQFSSSGRRYLNENAEVYKQLASQGLPVVISFIGEAIEPEVRKDFRDAGVLLSPDPAVTMQSLAWLYQRAHYATLPAPRPRTNDAANVARDDWEGMMQYLNDSGITPANWLVLSPSDRAEQACASLTYPLVVKVLPSESEHKTELGLVKLRVASPQDVDIIAADFRQRLGKPEAGILVQEMVSDGVEVVLSCLRNTDFGPVLSIGSGGVAIELYRDVANLALPVTHEQVITALKKLRLWTLLQGFRGKPPADVDALADAAVRFGDRFLATPDAQEYEINPVMVGAIGTGIRAVDALVNIRKAEVSQHDQAEPASA
ncbi:acetate--CoA ligase family protein [Advenella mimigardefordensis]|uniref:CoA-binding domain-containing protein n=1 Tax=Advenella mimigardefordensis (strain DSM 17166 / LMG 22922 / DPN7) TaxID=1247726 RepID=W0PBC7_ADVMD|nr:acetate--CoA ligase family protein [Advenella mimigardefordensis]AHG64169.1 CoA-binding domain-containing protein [Advenella mimigardefordensis DPN7]